MFENVKDLHGDTPEDELTAEQLFERLQGAKLVTENQRAQIEALRLELAEKDGEIFHLHKSSARLSRAMIDMAADLARAGSYDHKSKNEAILAVVYRLLARGNMVMWQPVPEDMDDITF